MESRFEWGSFTGISYLSDMPFMATQSYLPLPNQGSFGSLPRLNLAAEVSTLREHEMPGSHDQDHALAFPGE